MKQLLSTCLNWRFNVVAFIGLIGFFMACDETNRELLSFLAVKAGAVCIIFTAYRLAKYWNGKGYFKGLKTICKED